MSAKSFPKYCAYFIDANRQPFIMVADNTVYVGQVYRYADYNQYESRWKFVKAKFEDQHALASATFDMKRVTLEELGANLTPTLPIQPGLFSK